MLTEQTLKGLFSNLNVWKKGDERAPHKPLLLLLALAKVQQGQGRLYSFAEIGAPLEKLLREFGPARKSCHPEFPFYHLQSDHLWKLYGVKGLQTKKGKKSPTRKALLESDAKGGFPEQIFNYLKARPRVVSSLAQLLLENNFPESYWDDISAAVGLNLSPATRAVERRVRDPFFRQYVLEAYRFRCAVCNFGIRVENALIGVEASHIKWHGAGGPDAAENGLALCSLHHKLFDRGVFTVHHPNTIIVSPRANGTEHAEEWLFRFDKKKLRAPSGSSQAPHEEYLRWHQREVFKDVI